MTERWPEIDVEIFQNHIIAAIVIMREEFGYSIHEAIDAFSERYEHLRETQPEAFTVSREEYGRSFYS